MLIIMFYVFKYFNSHPFRISSPKFDETGQPNNTPTFSYDFDPPNDLSYKANKLRSNYFLEV